MNSLVLVAAGEGTRIGGSINKLLMEMHGHPLIWYTFKNILDSKLLDEIVIVVKDTEKSQFQQILSEFKHAIPIKWGQGGNTRVDSVINGISQISSNRRNS